MCFEMRIKIDNEIHQVSDVHDCGVLPMIETHGGVSYYLAEDELQALHAAKDKWRETLKHDPDEFLALVGEETVIRWGLGQGSFEDWLSDVDAAQEFATCNGTELAVDRVGQLASELGFTPTVAYRC